MTEQLDTSYPVPPDYFSRFTDENLARLEEADEKDGDLKFLIPPSPPPANDTYSAFGRTWQVNDRLPTLAEQNIPQLYPEGPIDRMVELKKLNHMIMFEFLDLVDVLIKEPSQFASRADRIRDIFVNIHHLINEYRGHQAKETLKLIMEQRIESKRTATKDTLAKCEELKQKIDELKQRSASEPEVQLENKEAKGDDDDPVVDTQEELTTLGAIAIMKALHG